MHDYWRVFEAHWSDEFSAFGQRVLLRRQPVQGREEVCRGMCHDRHIDILSEEKGKSVEAADERRPDDKSIIPTSPFVQNAKDDARNDDAPPVWRHDRDQASSKQHLFGDSRNERYEQDVAKVQRQQHLRTHAVFSIHAQRRHSPVRWSGSSKWQNLSKCCTGRCGRQRRGQPPERQWPRGPTSTVV